MGPLAHLASIKRSWGIALFGALAPFVVIDIADVQHDILNRQAFFTLMITAFFLNILLPLSITWWRPHYLKATSDESFEASVP